MANGINLKAFRNTLLRMRAEMVGDTHLLRQEGWGQESRMPIHMADGASDAADREFSIGRLSASSETLHLIDDALERIEAGTFGQCEECGAPIGERRLKVKPYASLCVACRQKEESA